MTRVLLLGLTVAALGLGTLSGCATPDGRVDALRESEPVDLPAFARDRLLILAEDFYARLESRRFNSIATFQDPGLHEFFRSRESYQDYYAELAHELENADFEASRPTSVRIQADFRASASRVWLVVEFVGKNGLPLRWWETSILRTDLWEVDPSGRWWIVPGKV
jgi:hypothetical protein